MAVFQGYSYVAIGLAATAFVNFPVAKQLLKPRPAKTQDSPALNPSEGGDMQEIVIEEEAPQKVAVTDTARICFLDISNAATTSVFVVHNFPSFQVVVEPTRVLTAPWAHQNEQQRRRAALSSSVSAPVQPASRAGIVSPFESMDHNGQEAAGVVGWPADGPREAHAFNRLTSFNAREAMLSVSVPEEETGTHNLPLPKSQAEAAEAQQNGMGGEKAAHDGGTFRKEILPRLR